MLSSEQLYLFGYSGHAYVVIDLSVALGYTIMGYFNPQPVTNNPYSLEYLGDEQNEAITDALKKAQVFAAIGDNRIRERLMNDPKFAELNFAILKDSSASSSATAKIGPGSLVCARAAIQSQSVIGKGCIVNTGAIIEHECKVGDFAHIAPGAVLAGNVQVGKAAFVGANATVKEGRIIGDRAVIGAGAVILSDIGPGETWVGNPGRRIQ
ncbi:acetyltransferase [Robiginitalea sp. IMCC43444]|uniref:acetyltransferase n=1 Tax=Robiginitalea sp. IMCC43444 TaxID=3459121 RepID=UPI0040432A8C